jgi:hypothetical protein
MKAEAALFVSASMAERMSQTKFPDTAGLSHPIQPSRFSSVFVISGFKEYQAVKASPACSGAACGE